MNKESRIRNYGAGFVKSLIHNSLFIIQNESGQSLVEIMIGLAIGGILIGAAAFAISVMLRSNVSIERSSSAVSIAQDLMDRVRAWGAADWQNVYGLTKGSGNKYYLSASGTTLFAVNGEEGILDNDVPNGLVGEWKFDEATSTTTYDTSGNGNNGTLVNGPARATSTCKISNCLGFNGTNQTVSIPHSSILKPSSQITIAAWVNPTTGTLNALREIYRKEDGTDRHLLSFQNTANCNEGGGTGGCITFGISTGGTYAELDVNIASADWENKWSYLVAAYDGSTKKIYKDGTLIGSVAASGAIGTTGTATAYIGSSYGGSEFFFGLIDDVRIYNRALSADEIKRLYSSNVYSRYFYAENVCRAITGSSTIVGIAPCSGSSTDDASTQQVTVNVTWTLPNGNVQVSSLTDFLTRAKNAIFDQTDWSGGAGQEGPLTQPNSSYASGANVDATSTPGSFKIKNLYPQ